MVEDSKEAEKQLPPPSQHHQQQEQQQLHCTRNPVRTEDFTRTIAKIAVAQLLENEGFQGFQQSALEALSDIAIRYIKELGKASSNYANSAGRSECNVFDLIRGLEELGLVQGFPGASDVHHSLSKSGVVREIEQYVNFVDNVPFVFDVPRFSVCRECKFSPSFTQLGEQPPGEHIPPWLPAFPGGEIKEDGSPRVEAVRDEPMEQQQLVVRDKVEANVNPFLAPPLKYGEKEVVLVEAPRRFFVRNHGDMMGSFGRMSGSYGMPKELREIEESNDTKMSVERPTVRFNLNTVKKRAEKVASCFSTEEEGEEEKDVKKSRIEESPKEFSETRELDSA